MILAHFIVKVALKEDSSLMVNAYSNVLKELILTLIQEVAYNVLLAVSIVHLLKNALSVIKSIFLMLLNVCILLTVLLALTLIMRHGYVKIVIVNVLPVLEQIVLIAQIVLKDTWI